MIKHPELTILSKGELFERKIIILNKRAMDYFFNHHLKALIL